MSKNDKHFKEQKYKPNQNVDKGLDIIILKTIYLTLKTNQQSIFTPLNVPLAPKHGKNLKNNNIYKTF